MKRYGPYTELVIKHFRNPHNYGRMKNPSAVGKVGNVLCGDVMWLYIKVGKDKKGIERIKDIKFETFGCLPSWEKVVTKEGGWKNISLINEGESIPNGDLENGLVKKVYKIPYEGILLKITPFVSPFNSFYITPEHPILCIKRSNVEVARKSSKRKWLEVDEKNLLDTRPDYVKAGNLEEGDFLIFTCNRNVKDNPFFTEELMKLIGYYLAEGYIVANGNVVAFSFNKKERDKIQEVKSLILNIINKKVKERTRKNVTEVYVRSRKFARLVYSIAGSLARNKKLSSEFMLLPPEKQFKTILKYLAGDGSKYKRRLKDSENYRIAIASPNLAIQVQEIFGRNGIFASIKERKVKKIIIGGREIKESKIYEIFYKLIKKHKFVRTNGKYFFVPIRKIEKKKFSGTVFNFHVEPGNSYLVKGFVVHNCLAAIATSSVITDLAKGKTLEEALKIDREDIVKSLGGLPPIKLHCSVLAADALNEALYDYFSKNKKTIPKILEQRHKRIEKEKKEIERRHGDWVKIEEEMHRKK